MCHMCQTLSICKWKRQSKLTLTEHLCCMCWTCMYRCCANLCTRHVTLHFVHVVGKLLHCIRMCRGPNTDACNLFAAAPPLPDWCSTGSPHIRTQSEAAPYRHMMRTSATCTSTAASDVFPAAHISVVLNKYANCVPLGMCTSACMNSAR